MTSNAAIEGQQCVECGLVDIGSRERCSQCLSLEFVEVDLGDVGTLYSFTILHTREEPFGLAYVDTLSGARLLVHLSAPFGGYECDQQVSIVRKDRKIIASSAPHAQGGYPVG